jgi:hypothetical protein
MKYWFAMSFSLLLASLPLASVTDHREHVLQVFARRRLDGSVFFSTLEKQKQFHKKNYFSYFKLWRRLAAGDSRRKRGSQGQAGSRGRSTPEQGKQR